MSDNQKRFRKRLLKIMPRSELERLSQMESPWHATRWNLEEIVFANWDARIRDDILTYLERSL
jgi:hypothetical protein